MAMFAKSGWIGNSYFLIVQEDEGYVASVTTPENTYNTNCDQMNNAMKWVEITINKFKKVDNETDRYY